MLASRLPAFEAKLRVRERKHPKLYWIDPGLVRAVGNRSGEPHAEEKGALLEGFIASVLRSCRDYLGLFDEFYYWAPATAKETEVDFLLQRNDRYTAIGVKSSPKILDGHLKGLRSFGNLEGLDRRILVYLGEKSMKTADGIDVWPFARFAENLDARHLWDN